MAANLMCLSAMMLWAFSFPAAEVLLETWGSIALVFFRQVLAVAMLLVLWVWLEGIQSLIQARWIKGFWVGGFAFGIGAICLLVGQAYSDAVIPAIAAAMMPVASAVLEVIMRDRKITLSIFIALMLVMLGGYWATGVRLNDSDFGFGALLCLFAIILFAWGTRATTRGFRGHSAIAQTTVTLVGAMLVMAMVYGAVAAIGLVEATIGSINQTNVMLILVSALISLGVAQYLWIIAAGKLGVMLASFHMNALPFYVMVMVSVAFQESWNWNQTLGALLVAGGVVVANLGRGRETEFPASR